MPVLQKTNNPTDRDILHWSNKDFLLYFSNRLEEITGNRLLIEGPAWAGFLSRIKGFRSKLHLGNIQYKEFVDKVFSLFFVKTGYVPAFGAIVSERVYYVVNRIQQPAMQYSDFDSLQKELYSNPMWFKHL